MAEQEMVNRQRTSPTGREQMRSSARFLTPAVDIFETDENLILVADLPGVDKDGLNINLEKGLLTINGEVKPSSRGESIFREFGSANYYRQFQISEHIDADKTSAEFKNGVLTLTIQKAEAAKPRRIEIRH